MSGVVLIGGVSVSDDCLYVVSRELMPIHGVIGYPESLKANSGWWDMQEEARKLKLPYLAPTDINTRKVLDFVKGADLLLVTGWSQLLKRPLLDACPLAVGMHPTALPQGRGRAPIPWTIIKGLTRSAATMFHLTEGVDDGDIIGQEWFDVEANETANSLYYKVSDAYVSLVAEYVPRLLNGTAPRTPQDHGKATYWPKRTDKDGRIDWSAPAEETARLIRALGYPYPGAWTELCGKRLRIWEATVDE